MEPWGTPQHRESTEKEAFPMTAKLHITTHISRWSNRILIHSVKCRAQIKRNGGGKSILGHQGHPWEVDRFLSTFSGVVLDPDDSLNVHQWSPQSTQLYEHSQWWVGLRTLCLECLFCLQAVNWKSSCYTSCSGWCWMWLVGYFSLGPFRVGFPPWTYFNCITLKCGLASGTLL